jgi:hypothetical protein
VMLALLCAPLTTSYAPRRPARSLGDALLVTLFRFAGDILLARLTPERGRSATATYSFMRFVSESTIGQLFGGKHKFGCNVLGYTVRKTEVAP